MTIRKQMNRWCMLPITIPFLAILTSVFFLLLPEFVLAQTWTHNGPWGAMVSAVAIDPSDTNTVYVGTESRGIWKSVDGGENWVQGSEGLPVWETPDGSNTHWRSGDQLPITMIHVHPNQQGILWVGTDGGGLQYSSNGGASWSPAGSGLPQDSKITSFAFKSIQPDTLFAGLGFSIVNDDTGRGGLYRSDDGGLNWSLIDTLAHGWHFSYVSLQIDPDNSDHIFAGLTSAGDSTGYDYGWGLLESIDGGNTWELINSVYSFYSIVIDPEDGEHLLARAYTGWMDWVLMESTDGGRTWEYLPSASDFWLWVILLEMDSHGNLYLGVADSLMTSDDFGQTWQTIARDVEDEITSIAVNPQNQHSMFIGSDNGLYHSSDGGITNEHSDSGIDNTYIQCIVPDPKDKNVYYAGGRYNYSSYVGGGFWKSENEGQSWMRLADDAVDVIVFDPLHPDTLYRGGERVMRSFDNGQTWEDIRGGMPGVVQDFEIHPTRTNIVYCATHDASRGGPFFFRSENCGDDWTEYVPDDPFFKGGGLAIYELIAPRDAPDEIYMTQEKVYRSRDTGLTWEDIYNDGPLGFQAMVKQPGTDRFHTSYGASEILLSTDRAESFTALTHPASSLTYTNLFLNPAWTDQLIVTTSDQKTFITVDNGTTWTSLDEPSYRTWSLAFSGDASLLFAGTQGEGVYVGNHVVSADEPPQGVLPNRFEVSSIYPNPFNSSVTVAFDLPRTEHITLKVYNIQGQLVRTLKDRTLRPGYHSVVWHGVNDSGQPLASGMYTLTLMTNAESMNYRLILLK